MKNCFDEFISKPVQKFLFFFVFLGVQVLVADGQMTLGNVVAKETAQKLRKLKINQKTGQTSKANVIVGFAGAAADGLALIELLEEQLNKVGGMQIRRAAVEMAKQWRTNRIFRHLEARMVVADSQHTLEIGGNGEVVEGPFPITTIGSGGLYALCM